MLTLRKMFVIKVCDCAAKLFGTTSFTQFSKDVQDIMIEGALIELRKLTFPNGDVQLEDVFGKGESQADLQWLLLLDDYRPVSWVVTDKGYCITMRPIL